MRSGKLTRTQQARRADIIQAAITVLWRDGYPGASIERIAAQADTTKGTLLYHFSSKEAVYEAVVTELYERGRAFMGSRLMVEESPGMKFRAYVEANLRFIEENVEHVKALHLILENSPSLAFEVDDGLAALCRLLEDGQRAGQFTTFDPRVVAIAIRAVIDRSAFHITDTEIRSDSYREETIRLLERIVHANPISHATGRTSS